MLEEIWKACYQSICCLNFLDEKKGRLGSGTGFVIGNFLVTNNHVAVRPNSEFVEIRFVEEDGFTIKQREIFPYRIFSSTLIAGDYDTRWDYALFDLGKLGFINQPSLLLKISTEIKVGHAIAVMGYQFDQTNLSIKSGIVSSKFSRADVKYLQLDASINVGNSGGPLISHADNSVIGIITRKKTGLSDAFDELINSCTEGIDALEKVQQPKQLIGRIAFAETFLRIQKQIKTAAIELKRSANVGIGYAFELDEVRKHIEQ